MTRSARPFAKLCVREPKPAGRIPLGVPAVAKQRLEHADGEAAVFAAVVRGCACRVVGSFDREFLRGVFGLFAWNERRRRIAAEIIEIQLALEPRR